MEFKIMTSTPFCDCCNQEVPFTIGVDLPQEEQYPVNIVKRVASDELQCVLFASHLDKPMQLHEAPCEYEYTGETQWITHEERCVHCFIECAMYPLQERIDAIEANFQRAFSR